jgi:formylglycine-generating enzyme required for sulfatase activity
MAFDRSVVLDPMIERLKKDRGRGVQPEAVFVTGDVAFKGGKHEYQQAGAFFEDLLSAIDLSASRLFMVPGNHDVDRRKYRPRDIPAYETMAQLNMELENEDYRTDLLKGMSAYFEFVESCYPHMAPLEGRLVPFVNVIDTESGQRLGLVGLNSAWMCRKSPDERTIAIGEYQIKAAFDALNRMGPVDLTLVLAHHPLEWLWPVDRNICRQYLNGVVMFAGHLHETGGGFSADFDGDLFKFQAGGAYLGSESAWPCRYQYLTLDWRARKLRLDFRRFYKEKRRWVVDAETGRDGAMAFTLPTLQPESPAVCKAPLEIPHSYHNWIETCCSYVDTQKLQVAGKAIRIELPDVFIPLYAYPPHTGDESHLQERAERLPEDLEKLIAGHPDLLIEGEPGSGKTTVLKHLAYGLATMVHDLPALAGWLPVLVFLKDLQGFFQGEGAACTVEDLLSAYFTRNENNLDFKTVAAFAASGKALFMLDGLDEISPSQRGAVVRAFVNFRSRYQGNKFVFSGRPHGVVGPAMDCFGRRHVKILPLTLKQVEAFAVKWFQFIYPSSEGRGKKTAEAMLSEIRDHRAIKRLIENPLLLTAICILYYGGGELPGQRAELYKRFVENLLHRRFEEPESVHQFLASLAFQMQTRAVRGVDKAEALEILGTVLPIREHEAPEAYRARLEQEFDRIEPQCGLLQLESGQYNFRHLTFQEFLAAAYLVITHLDYAKAINPFWQQEHFKEVIELYVGLLSIDNQRWAHRIVQENLDMPDEPPFYRWRLAARCLLDVDEKKREIDVVDQAAKQLRTIISEDLDTKSLVDAGETLGRLGDRRDLEAFIPVPGGEYPLESGSATIEPFEISKFPVTNQWFAKFIADHGYENPAFWSPEGRHWLKHSRAETPLYWQDFRWNCPNSPVVGVCWYEADAFCRWLTDTRGDRWCYLLPSGDQWEAAAAGFQRRQYPWGPKWQDGYCNTEESGIQKTSPVGVIPRGNTPEGVADMSGNVWEWTRTDGKTGVVQLDFKFDQKMDQLWQSGKVEELIKYFEEKGGSRPEIRGGSWDSDRGFARCAYRYVSDPYYRDYGVGFRCVRIKKR